MCRRPAEAHRHPRAAVTTTAGRHRSTKRHVSVRNAFRDGVWTFESRNGPNGVRKRRCRVSRSSAARARLCAPSPSSCLAVFVEIAGGNRVRCYSTIDLVVIINHTGRFARVFAHACAYTTARPHDRTTARPHDRTTARPHDRTTARRPRNIAAFRAFARPLLLKMANRNGKRKRETKTRLRFVLLCRSVLLSWFHGRVVVSAVDGTRGRIMVFKRAVPISTLELQSRVEHADAMATRRSRSSLRDDNRMVVASRRRGGHDRDGRRFAATKRSRSSLRDDDIDNEVVMSWRSPLRGDETVAVVASRRDDGMMAVASRRRGGHGGDGRRFAATRWSQLYFLPCFHTSTVWTNEDGMLTPMSLFSGTKVEMVQDGEFVRHVHVTVFRNKNGNGLLFDSECPPAAGAQSDWR